MLGQLAFGDQVIVLFDSIIGIAVGFGRYWPHGVICLVFAVGPVAAEENPARKSFAYIANIQPINRSQNTNRLNKTFAALYQPRKMANIYVENQKEENGKLIILSDTEGFFTLDFVQPQYGYRQEMAIPELLSKAKFHSRALSQPQFKPHDLSSVVDRAGFFIVTFMTAGHSSGIRISHYKFRALLSACPEDGSISHHVEDEYTPTDITITKKGNRVSRMEVKNKYEESVGVFDSPVASIDDKWTATLTIKYKDHPDGVRARLTKQKTIFSEVEIDRIYQAVLATIPPRTKLLLAEKDEPIPKEWGGAGFVPLELPESIRTANEQRMAAMRGGWSYYTLGTVGVVAAGALFLIWKTLKGKYSARSVLVLGCWFLGQDGARAQMEDGPYCGLYCVKASAAALDRNIPFESLRQPEFLTGNPGSSTDDLVRALKLAGLTGVPRQFLSVS